MKTQQMQLMLIIDNVNVPLTGKATVYEDVMDAWTKSLTTLDKLISGVPQSVQRGEALLGLCAWHIYPDICALGKTTTFVKQKDDLAKKGGLLTLGIVNAHHESDAGISWSMPLEQLRYYGRPVLSHGMVGTSKSRARFDNILQVAIGSMLGTWGHAYNRIDDVMKFLIAFGDIFRSRVRTQAQMIWPILCSDQAKAYLASPPSERKGIARYIGLGQRRFSTFLAEVEDHPSPCFSMSDPTVFLDLQSSEQQISTLRDLASLSGDESLKGSFIRWIHVGPEDDGIWEYASLLPQPIAGTTERAHGRWLIFPVAEEQIPQRILSKSEMQSISAAKHQQNIVIRRSLTIIQSLGEYCGFLDASTMMAGDDLRVTASHDFVWSRRKPLVSQDIVIRCADQLNLQDALIAKTVIEKHGSRLKTLDHGFEDVQYTFLQGDEYQIAIFSPFIIKDIIPKLRLPIDYITQSMTSARIDSEHVFHRFEYACGLKVKDDNYGLQNKYYQSLIALGKASEIYNNLPNAEVDLNVASKSLWSRKWASRCFPKSTSMMTRCMSFACVTLFETGILDLEDEIFKDVIAISSTNNIYASENLFRDPWYSSTQDLRHVTGNLGKPGLALLLHPSDSILREPDLDTWELINHSKYDGTCGNHFTATSLHLRLTGYESPVNLGFHGQRDKEVCYVEAVVSVHDSGTWVADIDITYYQKIADSHVSLQCLPASCTHDIAQKKNMDRFRDIVSVDNWYEFIDAPYTPGLIRAHGNWLARLAMAAAPTERMHRTMLACPNVDICWTCVQEVTTRVRGFKHEDFLILC